MSSAFRPLMLVVEADYGRIANSTIRALSDVRPSAGLLLCLAFNILVITSVAVPCVSGYGLAMGLSIVVLALAPTLMLLNIALFAWVDEGWQPSPLRAVSTGAQAPQPSETLDEKNPSLVPETSATANTQAPQPSETLDEKNPSIVPETPETANTQASQRKVRRVRLRLGPAARRKLAEQTKVQGT